MIDKKEIEKAVLKSFSDVTGLDAESVNNIRDKNLLESGVINSLVLSSLIDDLEDELDIRINIMNFELEDFKTLNTIIDKFVSLIN